MFVLGVLPCINGDSRPFFSKLLNLKITNPFISAISRSLYKKEQPSRNRFVTS